MLSLTAPIKTRLQALPALTGWAVRTGTEQADRRIVPVADVRLTGARVPESDVGVLVSPEWTVTLVVRSSEIAADQLSAAFAAVIESLQNWAPGEVAGRRWDRLRLVRATPPDFVDEGMAGVEIAFSTSASFDGQP